MRDERTPATPRGEGPRGRDTLTRALRAGLVACASDPRPWVLLGPVGVGTSTLAAEYVRRYGGEYDAVYWVDAGDPYALARDCGALAAALGVAAQPAWHQREAARVARDALEARGRWLCVFDGVVDPAALADYVPVGGGHVLLTTACADVAPALAARAGTPPPEVLVVPPLSRAEAAALLADTAVGPEDHGAAADVAEILGGVPLALSLAAAWMRAGERSLAECRARLVSLADAAPDGGARAPVRLAVALALESLEAVRGATSVLCTLALFAPDVPVPEALAARAAAFFADDAQHRVARTALRAHGLVRATPEGLRVHPGVATWVRQLLPPARVEAALELALVMASTAVPGGALAPEQWPAWSALLPHALAAATRAADAARRPDLAAALASAMGVYLHDRGEHALALRVLERALGTLQRLEGERGAAVVTVLRVLGQAAGSLRDTAAARGYLLRALAIVEAADVPDPVEIGRLCYRLGFALDEGRAPREAVPWFERALAIAERLDRPGVLSAFDCASRAAYHLYASEQYAAARALYERSLVLAEREGGLGSAPALECAANLAEVHFKLEDYAGARAAFARALALRANAGTDAEREVGGLHWRLGDVAERLGDLAAARDHYAQALAIYHQVCDEQHPAVGALLAALAWVAQRAGDLDDAQAHYEAAARVEPDGRFGFERGDAARFALRVGRLFRTRGRADAALEWLERARREHERAGGLAPLEAAGVLGELGRLWWSRGDLPRAWTFFEQAVALAEAAACGDHPDVRELRLHLTLGSAAAD